MKIRTNLTSEELLKVAESLSNVAKSKRISSDPENAFRIEIDSKVNNVMKIYSDSLLNEIRTILLGS